MDDLISRQSVNDAMDRTCDLVCEYSKKQRYSMCGGCPLGCAFDAVADLPSTQPDITEKQIAEYCRKRDLVLITYESYEILKAYYNRRNSI